MSVVVRLRPWTSSDLPVLVELANNFNIARYMTDVFPFPYTPEHAESFLSAISAENPLKVLAIEADGILVGSVGFFPQSDIHRMSAEMGYWLAEPHWGKGIAAEAVRQMLDYGCANWKPRRIYARPFGSNIQSQRVLEKAGFKLEACLKDSIIKNGKFEDELIYSIIVQNKL